MHSLDEDLMDALVDRPPFYAAFEVFQELHKAYGFEQAQVWLEESGLPERGIAAVRSYVGRSLVDRLRVDYREAPTNRPRKALGL